MNRGDLSHGCDCHMSSGVIPDHLNRSYAALERYINNNQHDYKRAENIGQSNNNQSIHSHTHVTGEPVYMTTNLSRLPGPGIFSGDVLT